MPPIIALVLCSMLVMTLLYIDRQRFPETSFALWISTAWLLIVGSRPIAAWLNPDGMTFERIGSVAEGSGVDRLVLSGLILVALLVIAKRRISWSLVFKYNVGLLLVYLLIGYSILWADYPYVSLKRWVRILGTIVMSVLVLSECKPEKALESLFLRTSYILIPFSFLLIQWFPHYGVDVNLATGERMWVGVTTQKNSLGQFIGVSSFILVWLALRKWKAGELFKNKKETYPDLFILGLGIYMLRGSDVTYSATAIVIFVVSVFSLLILNWRNSIASWVAANLKVLFVSMVVIIFLAVNTVLPIVTSLLGRDVSLTGRVEIWRELLDAASRSPWFGVGFGSFWVTYSTAVQYGVMQGHNGYIDVILDLGAFGIVLLMGFLFWFCGKLQKELNRSYDWAVLGICFLMVVLLYNVSESSFFANNYLWSVFVFVTMIFSQDVKKENMAGYVNK